MMVRIVSIPKEVIMKEVWSKSWKKVLIWACGFVSLIAFAVAGGYAIVKGEDESVKRVAKQCFVVTLIFLAANALISILSSIAGLAASAGLAEVLQWLNFILLIAKIGIYAAAIESYAVFRCIATDTDSTSNTYNGKFMDVATFIDNSDPIQVVITSTGGDVFKNGQGSTVLTAVVYQAGAEIDASGKGTYTWTKYNKDGEIDTSWGTNGSKSGKTLSVSTADVATKATFMVVVTI